MVWMDEKLQHVLWKNKHVYEYTYRQRLITMSSITSHRLAHHHLPIRSKEETKCQHWRKLRRWRTFYVGQTAWCKLNRKRNHPSNALHRRLYGLHTAEITATAKLNEAHEKFKENASPFVIFLFKFCYFFSPHLLFYLTLFVLCECGCGFVKEFFVLNIIRFTSLNLSFHIYYVRE